MFNHKLQMLKLRSYRIKVQAIEIIIAIGKKLHKNINQTDIKLKKYIQLFRFHFHIFFLWIQIIVGDFKH